MQYRNKYLYIFSLLLSLITFSTATAQSIVVEGFVRDSTDQQPIENASVQSVEFGMAAITNEDGYFRISLPQQASFTFEIRHIAYQNKRINWVASENPILIQMSAETAYLEVVEVSSDRNSLPLNGLQRIKPIPVNEMATPFNEFNQLLATFSGVVSNNELSSSYSVRGGNFDENLVYVNGIEVYRPFLIRAGQQEGLSFINPDLVKNIQFSAGGWEAQYGDKLSSNLLIEYKDKIDSLEGKLNLGLLGSSAYVGLPVGENAQLLNAVRYKNAQYLFNTFDTEGEYLPEFLDVQSFYSHKFSDKTELDLLLSFAQNNYFVRPSSRETDFGAFQQNLRFIVAFDGAESLNYRTFQIGNRLTHRFSEKFVSRLNLSFFTTSEFEYLNTEGAYRLCDIDRELGSDTFDECINTLGIGSNFRYARNYLDASILQLINRNDWQLNEDQLISAGLEIKRQLVSDRLDEFSFRDSADFVQFNRIVEQENDLEVYFTNLYAQHEWELGADTKLISGFRINYSSLNKDVLISPRVQLTRTNVHQDNSGQFSVSAGLYRQYPFYRELRDSEGSLNTQLKAQTAYHFILSYDKVLKIWNRPFQFNSSAYYKYLRNIIPYEIDNVRIRYLPQFTGRGYAYGTDVRLTGEFIPNTQSWINLSLLSTKELIPGLTEDFIRRPADQRLTASIFFQDHFIDDPTTKVNLRLVVGTGLPFGPPQNFELRNQFNGEWYRRIDVGFAKELKRPSFIFPDAIKKIQIGLDVLNLLGVSNAISYNWIEDFSGSQYAVPNTLSTRFFNFKFLVSF